MHSRGAACLNLGSRQCGANDNLFKFNDTLNLGPVLLCGIGRETPNANSLLKGTA